MLGGILLTLAVIALLIMFGERFTDFRFGTRLLGLIPALLVLNQLRIYFNNVYIFTNRAITQHKGLLSTSYGTYSIEYKHIRNAMVTQNLRGRILNYGDIMLDTAATDSVEIFIQGIYAPRQLLKCVENITSVLNKQKKNATTT